MKTGMITICPIIDMEDIIPEIAMAEEADMAEEEAFIQKLDGITLEVVVNCQIGQ